MKRLYSAIIILMLVSVTFLTCDIGLGHKINMKGPVVEISGPGRSANQNYAEVNEVFTLNGTAQSVSTITLMTITIDYYNKENLSTIRMGREWKWEGNWYFHEGDNEPWKIYTSADYRNTFVGSDQPVPPPSWNAVDTVVYWSIPVKMDQMQTGEYTITVSAWDSAGNYDSNSFKKWKVLFSNEAPNLRILIPELKNSQDGSSLTNPTPPDHSVYVFDPFGNPEGTYSHRSHFISSFKDVAYTIVLPPGKDFPEGAYDDGYKLTIELTNPHNITGTEGKTTYWSWKSDDNWAPRGIVLPRSGVYTATGITGSNVSFPALGNFTKVGDSITINPNPPATLPNDRVTPMQFVSNITEKTGNFEFNSKGWVFYLPDADKPYAHIGFGYKVRAGEVPPSYVSLPTIQRGGESNLNYAYDNDGVRSIKRELYRVDDNYNELGSTAPNYYLLDQINITANNTTRTQWPFQAEGRFGTGKFKVVVTVTDVNGKVGDPYYAYFTILSNSTPTIIPDRYNSSNVLIQKGIENEGEVLWGNQNGTVTISGIAQVEDYDECNLASGVNEGHQVRVDRVTIAWTNPKLASDPTNITRFADQNAAVWNMARTLGTLTSDGSRVYTDPYGNKIWEVANNKINFAGNAGNKNPNSQEDWKFELDINIFSDLNIGNGAGQNPFDAQLFYVRVGSLNQQGTELSSMPRSFTTRGDQTRPVIAITKIFIEDATTIVGGQEWNWELMLPSVGRGTKIRLYGTWSDDSMRQWSGVANRHISRMGGLPVIRWEGELNQFTFNMQSAKFLLTDSALGSGTWETEWHEFTALNDDAIVFLSANLQDLAGNPGQNDRQITITTNNPTLTRISSTAVDGAYGTGTIEIFLDFNQAITLNKTPYTTGGVLNDVTYAAAVDALRNDTNFAMTLSNGGTARYTGGAGTTRLTFSYVLGTNNGTSTINRANLNVTSIANLYENAEPYRWAAVTDNAKVIFPRQGGGTTGTLSVLSVTDPMSLARQKNIVIDRESPKIEEIITYTAIRTGGYGRESRIYITVIFDEVIKVTGSPTLTLNSGGTARYQNTVGEDSLSFEYEVLAGQNALTGLVATQFNLNGGTIKDLAENSYAGGVVQAADSKLNSIIIDTTPPSAPSIANAATIGNTTYYGDFTFVITGLESNATVEYSTVNSGTPSWTTYTGNITSGQTLPISIPLNGTYSIVARQYDDAETNKNVSASSTAVGGIIINRGEILERFSSANPDGVYSFQVTGKENIDIDVYFRVPVNVSAIRPTLVLNTDPQKTAIYSAGTGTQKLTFRYTLAAEDRTPAGVRLDVTGINYNGGSFNDTTGKATPLNEYIHMPADNASGRFNMQKNITVLRGYPDLIEGNNRIVYSSGSHMEFTFDRDIYRGDTENKFMIMQTETGYRMPIVLTERRFAELFNSRTDIWATNSPFTNAKAITMTIAQWKAIGEALYEKGSNGATAAGTGDVLTSDTTVKYVLKYNINPNNAEAVTVGGTTYTAAQIMTILRAAEAVVYSSKDQGVTITNSGNDPRILRINLNGATTGGTSLPVLGASYEWKLPNGFVKDSLGKANGGSISGDHVLSTSNVTYSGIEPPVIRVNKDVAVQFTDNTQTRQIQQPLQSAVKVESRTPGAGIEYTYRSKDDSAGNLIWRNDQNAPGDWNAANYTRYLPNTGNRTWQSYQNTRMRPQSGVNGLGNFSTVDPSVNWVALGLNFNATMAANWTTNATTGTASPFNIGSENYMTGGQEYNIRARARVGTGTWSGYTYEAAYRSVFVFNKQTINGNTAGNNVRLNMSANNNGKVPANILNRIWIRGGDSTSGDPTTPNFPLARDPSKYRTIKLLTPINATTDSGFTYANRNTYNRGHGNIVNNISATDYGDYLWFWVTWGINVPAYVDVLYGPLPASTTATQAPTQTQALFQGWVPCKEHYAVFPGRTTVVETRDGIYNNMWDGQHGNLDIASAVTPPAQSD